MANLCEETLDVKHTTSETAVDLKEVYLVEDPGASGSEGTEIIGNRLEVTIDRFGRVLQAEHVQTICTTHVIPPGTKSTTIPRESFDENRK